MRLISIPVGGYYGTIDLGRVGVTGDNPSDPEVLGLPVT
jgi:hypothetical protein